MSGPPATFASTGDLGEKQVSFTPLGDGAFAYTAEGDPNTGVIIGDDGVMVIDTQATPLMAGRVLEKIRAVTDKPIKYVLLTHYHAVRVLGASAFRPQAVIASRGTYEMIVERGQEDYDSEAGRFPRLFQGIETVPGLTWPTIVFDDHLTVDLGNKRVEILHPGKGHTQGDTIAWLAGERILFSGDLVEYKATPYSGDAHLADWPETLRRLRAMQPNRLVPGRGDALTTPEDCAAAMTMTEAFVTDLFETARDGAALNLDLKTIYQRCRERMDKKYGDWVIYEHCMPFNVTRAWDEARGIRRPRVWTAQRDQEMWAALEG